ncbi:MAG: septal ring lytic transglycosylase RlpA family protein [Candidatus Omnitrophota bacterium]|jgi:rare lipoprotein A|nr:MAG: septal ring lytic transglycosylase RlpA family protein [Candidatus Omnitrophota bacterium]
MIQRLFRNSLRGFLIGLVGVLILSFTGCGGFKVVRIPIPIPTFGFGKKTEQVTDRSRPPSPTVTTPGAMEGLASWYGRQFQGRRTASGERFDMNKLTAAHNTLPFNTKVRVTNLENGNSVIVRINDRGPSIQDRIIDVSLATARRLDFERQGVARVRLDPL